MNTGDRLILISIWLMVLALFMHIEDSCAGPYVELGLGYSPFVTDERCNEICFRDEKLGIAEIGWTFRPIPTMPNFSAQPKCLHVSGLAVHDKGFDACFGTVRYEWK